MIQDSELSIVYSILNTYREEHQNDEALTERLIRDYMRTHRPDCLRKYYSNGITVTDEVFQTKSLLLEKIGNNEFAASMPKIIQFDKKFGFYLMINNIPVPIESSESYDLSKTNRFNKYLVRAKTEYDKIIVYGGITPNTIISNSPAGFLVQNIYDQVHQQEIDNYNNPDPDVKITISATLKAVLVNPDDGDGYNWESDIYPFPAEKLKEFKQQIMVQEFGMIRENKKDEIQNARADQIRYHDNDDVNNG